MTPLLKSPRLAISYARWSSEKQSAGDSARRQASMVSDYCARHGLTLDTSRSMIAAGVSAYKGRNVAAGSALAGFLDAVKAKQIPRDSVLLIEGLDRLSRLPALDALDVLRRICATGVTVVTLEDHREYTEATLRTDSTSLFVALSVAIRANEESRRKSERVRGAWKSRRDDALVKRTAIKGRIPAWLKWTEGVSPTNGPGYKVIEDKARVVRQVFAWATTEGLGADAITRRLNDAKVPTFGWAKQWERSYVRLLLHSPQVVGDVPLSSGGASVGVAEGLYPAIVERRLWLQVQERRASNRPLPSGPRTLTNLWTGLATCGECDSPLHHVSKGRRRPRQQHMAYLVCARARHGKGCSLPYVDARAFELMTVGCLARHLDWRRVLDVSAKSAATAVEVAEEKAAMLAGQLQAIEQRRANVFAAIEAGNAPASLVARLGILDADMVRLQADHEGAMRTLENARVTAQTVERDTRHCLDSFMAYLDKTTDADTRTRLAQVLREVVNKVSVRAVDGVKQVEVSFRLPGLTVLRFDLIEPRRRR